jgi:uncharacterized ion transporter superfamily protein YfcC
MRKKTRNKKKVDVGYTLFIVACFAPIIIRGFVPIPDFWFRIIFATFLVVAVTVWIFYSYRDKKHPDSFFNWSLKKSSREKTLDERYSEMIENQQEMDDEVEVSEKAKNR